MRQLILLVGLHIRRIVRRPSFVAALLLPVFLLVLIGVFSPKTRESTLVVGIYIEEESALADAFYEELLAVQTAPVSFVLAESRAELEELVAATVWECGYVLPGDFSRRLEDYDLSKMFTRVTSPSTSMQMLSNSAVLAALLSLISDEVAAHYLDGVNVMDEEAFFHLIETNQISTPPFQASFDITPLHGDTQTSSQAAPITSALKAVIALGLFLVFLLATVALSAELRSGFFSRMAPFCGRSKVLFSPTMAILLIGAVEALLLFALAAWFEPAYWANGVQEALALLLYLLYLTALSFFVSAALRLNQFLFAFLPFMLLASLLLTPVFVDISRFIPALYPLSLLLPPALYFRASEGNLTVSLLMLAATLVLLVLSHLIILKRKT